MLLAGIVGFVAALGLKVGHAGVDPFSLLILSLGLICLALGLGARLELQKARLKLRVSKLRPGSPVPPAEEASAPSAWLLYAGFALIGLSWLALVA